MKLSFRVKVTQHFKTSAAVGKVEEAPLEADFLEPVNLLMTRLGLKTLEPDSTIKQCHRMQVKSQVFQSSRYSRISVTNSYTVEFRHCDGYVCYGEVVQ